MLVHQASKCGGVFDRGPEARDGKKWTSNASPSGIKVKKSFSNSVTTRTGGKNPKKTQTKAKRRRQGQKKQGNASPERQKEKTDKPRNSPKKPEANHREGGEGARLDWWGVYGSVFRETRQNSRLSQDPLEVYSLRPPGLSRLTCRFSRR